MRKSIDESLTAEGERTSISLEKRMTNSFGSRVVPTVALLLLAGTAIDASAQTCRGMPRGGGIAFVRGSEYLGTTYGVAASKGVLALGFNSLTSDTDISAWDGNIRFTIPIGASKFQICPGFGLEYKNQDFTVSDGSELTARNATAAAGISFGYTQALRQGLSLAPFVGVDYRFTGTVFSLDTPDQSEDELSGDTLSYVSVQYGAVVQYKSFYAGFAADRATNSDGPGLYRARLLLGFAFGGGDKSSRAAAIPRPPAIRASERR